MSLASSALYLYNRNGSTAIAANGTKVAYFDMMSGNIHYYLVPFKGNKMIDLNAIGVEGRQLYYENAGSGAFTIEYTLPDGTPWTPSTP